MTCKNCGANILDGSKVCSVCGASVEDVTPTVSEVQPQEVSNNLNEQPAMSTISEPVVSSTYETPVVQNNYTSPEEPKKKKGKAGIIALVVVLLAAIGVGAYFLISGKDGGSVLGKKNSNSNTIETFKDAVKNLENAGDKSGTLKLGIDMESSTGDTFNLGASMKYEIADENNMKMEIKVDKSLITDEILAYVDVTNKNLKLYAQSSLIDLVGMTSSDENIWLNYSVDLTELESELTEITNNVETKEAMEKLSNIDLAKVFDDKHLSYVGKSGDLDQYKVTIDYDLMKNLSDQLPEEDRMTEEEAEEIKEEFNEIPGGKIELNIYIDSNKQFKKFDMDLAKIIDDDSIKKALITYELTDLNKTVVTIPSEALNSTTDLMEYISSSQGLTVDDDLYDQDIYKEYNETKTDIDSKKAELQNKYNFGF